MIYRILFLFVIVPLISFGVKSYPIEKEKIEEETFVVEEEMNVDGAPSTSNASELEYCGTYTITFYCSACNTPPNSTATSTGRYVPGYSVASSDFAPGTILVIDGEEYRVDDCGCAHGVIDRLVDGSNGCRCNEYGKYTAEVYLRR